MARIGRHGGLEALQRVVFSALAECQPAERDMCFRQGLVKRHRLAVRGFGRLVLPLETMDVSQGNVALGQIGRRLKRLLDGGRGRGQLLLASQYHALVHQGSRVGRLQSQDGVRGGFRRLCRANVQGHRRQIQMRLHKIRADLDRTLIFQPRVKHPSLLLVRPSKQIMTFRELRRHLENVPELDDGLVGLALGQVLLAASEVLHPLRLWIATATGGQQTQANQEQEQR